MLELSVRADNSKVRAGVIIIANAATNYLSTLSAI